MHAIKFYITPEDFDEFIKSHLNDDEAVEYIDYEWVPVKIDVTDNLDIEVTAVAAI